MLEGIKLGGKVVGCCGEFRVGFCEMVVGDSFIFDFQIREGQRRLWVLEKGRWCILELQMSDFFRNNRVKSIDLVFCVEQVWIFVRIGWRFMRGIGKWGIGVYVGQRRVFGCYVFFVYRFYLSFEDIIRKICFVIFFFQS